MKNSNKKVNAAIIVIGNEILSGRTQEVNVVHLSKWLNELGVKVEEVRIIPDKKETIVSCIREVKKRYKYIFTTGGIGPTHDDITVDSVGTAFGLPVDFHPEAVKILKAHYAHTGAELNQARMRMARTPLGASLVENPVSKAPGFRIENVYVLAGIPSICQAMFHSLKHELVGGDPMRSVAIAVYLGEGALAKRLAALQDKYLDVGLGSYPFYRDGRFGVSIVARSQSPDRLAAAADEIRQMIRDLDGEPIEEAEA